MNETKETKMFVAALLTNAYINTKILRTTLAGQVGNALVANLEIQKIPNNDEDMQASVWKAFQKYLADLNKD